MADALRELVLYFGADSHEAEGALNRIEGGVGGLIEKFKGVTTAIAGFFAFGEIKEFFEATIQQGAHLEDLANRLGVGTDELQKFQFAAKLAGVDAEGASHSLGLLNRKVGEAAKGHGEAAKEMQKLGVPIKNQQGDVRELGDLIFDFADAIKALPSQQERAAVAMKLFGRAGQQMLPLLMKGGDELRKVEDQFESLGGMMSEDFIKRAKEADDEIIKMHVAFEGLRIRAVNAFLPRILKLIEGFQSFAKRVQEVLDQTHFLEHAFQALKIGAIVLGVYKLITGFKTLATTLLLNPMTLWIVAIAAAILIFDDLATALEGGKSLFGDYFGKTGIEALKEGLSDAKILVDFLYGGVEGVVELLESAGHLLLATYKGFKAMFSGDKTAAAEAQNEYREVVTHFKAAFTPDEYSTAAVEGFNRPMSPLLAGTPEGSVQGRPVTGFMRGVGDVNTTNHINVTVQHQSTDNPERVGQAVGRGVQKEIDKKLTEALNAGKRK